MTKKKYDEDSIKVFKGLSGVRKKPTMYLGELGDHAVLQMLKEVVENSVDEALIGENDFITVKVEGKKTPQIFTIIDRGRGIPVKKHKKTKKSTLTTIFTTLHSGGKFDDESYKTAIGTHGLGVSCTTALSKRFEVWTYREENWHYQRFRKGKPKDKVVETKFPKSILKGLEKNKKRGTIIRFSPDYKIIGKKARVTQKTLQSWLKDISNLNTKLKIRLVTDEIDEIYYNKGGPKEYLKDIIKQRKVETLGKPFLHEDDTLVVALQWSDFEGEDGILSYVNGALTEEGGTHLQGLYSAVTKGFKSGRKKNHYSSVDLRYGVVGFINIKLYSAEFDSQTKNKLVTTTVKKQVEEYLLIPFEKFLNKNKRTAKIIVRRAIEIKKAKNEARKIQRAASQIRGTRKTLLPGKLITASNKTPSDQKELYIVEGLSAAGTAKDARNRMFQEILCLKGKPLNVARSSMSKILNNKEIQNILIAVGINSKEIEVGRKKKQENNFRAGKIILLSDSDVDGAHISVLVLTVFYYLCPTLFDRQMIYVVDAPLYFANYKNKKYYGYSLNEIQNQLGKLKVPITRAKGWGEVNFDVLREIAFDTKSRKLIRIEPAKGENKVYFKKMVADDTSTRKEILNIA